MGTLLSNLRYAFRQMSKTPGLALLAIVTLALGVGANTAIFTVIESVLLRPLPYANSNRLIFVGPAGDKPNFGATSWLNYSDIRAQSKLLQDAAGYSGDISVMENQAGSESVVAPRVTTNLFSMLGVKALLGRTFTDEEGLVGGPSVVLLSERVWRESFHGDAGVLGQVVKVGGQPHIVVGVMPSGFRFPEEEGSDVQKGVWLPLQPTATMQKDRGYNFFKIVGERGGGAARIGCDCQAHTAWEGRASACVSRGSVSGSTDRPGAAGTLCIVWRADAGVVDCVRERVEPADCAVPGKTAGVCGAVGAGRGA